MGLREDALKYHKEGKPGKIEISVTKDCKTQRDITLAYSPGVAEPCKEIARDPNTVFDYTAKGNLVAVVSNGTAVLGLGNIGPLAAKPVMEGKAVLFKMFSDIDCFDIELNAPTVEEVIATCKALEPTFGGINLEDIKAPECFEIEERLKESLNIPVFHDDQHGTAIVSAAALLNAIEITNRKIENIKVVINGAGAAAIACGQMYINIGVRAENLIMCDSKGVVYKGRTDGMNKYKERFANGTKARTLKEAMAGADVFCGCSVAGAVTQDMVKAMAKDPIVFAMANPDPEIRPEDVLAVRPDAIIATGRSDYPNQVNNVLGYPYIFRGALDVRARQINEEMKMAAVKAIAALAKEDVPDSVSQTYDKYDYSFGRDYLIPKPFDQRLLLWVAPAVARAAIETGVSRKKIDIETYVDGLESRLGVERALTRRIKKSIAATNRAAGKRVRVVFPEGSSPQILRAAELAYEDGLCEPIFVGRRSEILATIAELRLDKLVNPRIEDPAVSPKAAEYASRYYEARSRKGVTRVVAAETLTRESHHFAAMMVEMGEADAYLSGVHHNYPDAIRPALEIIGAEDDKVLAGVYMLLWKDRSMFFADTTVNIDPSSGQLAHIAIQTHDLAKLYLAEKPRVAALSFSNFGSNKHPHAQKVTRAVEIVKELRPDIEIDGEIQADVAVSAQLLSRFSFTTLKGPANVLIFPDVSSGNIAYKLLKQLGGATLVGPLLMGMKKPVNVLQRNSTVDEIVSMIAFTVHRVQNGF